MLAMSETAPRTCLVVAERVPKKGAAACELANGYLQSISAYWRGEPNPLEFGQWLSSFWDPTLHPGVFGTADATSPHGAGGRGISWYETSVAVVGVITGRNGGYRIPIDAITPGSSIMVTPSKASLVPNTSERLPECNPLFTSWSTNELSIDTY